MATLNYFKSGEVLIEDDESGDVHECFVHMDGVRVYVTDDDNETLFELDADSVPHKDEVDELTVPEGYRAHEIGWRFTEFDIQLKDPKHQLTPEDFTWHWKTIGDYEYQVLELNEEVGELEFQYSSDGRWDEDLELD